MTSLPLTVLDEGLLSITFGWTPVSGATGYRFTRQGFQIRSHTWNPERSSVKFAKGSRWYRVEALFVSAEGDYALPSSDTYPGEVLS